ncbi:MAG: hypothetical protein JNN06_03270 [Gemmobacter sp.]|uniref:hypothetical protein n=1 Tax=Gemmobacter sp. TaxID=1898957 RepID=UPI001A4206AD|nr:hypothetical protein [Gemmobacter sp.]MBL8561279.1 hypothetical protein [Gemmobacter sp.]
MAETETIHEVYANAAGLLRAHGFYAAARAEPPAIITDAGAVMVGFSVGQVAIDPEPYLPNRFAPGGKAPGTHGRLWAWSVDP